MIYHTLKKLKKYFLLLMQFIVCNLARDYELDRNQIFLTDILGQGQFGDVHAGIYTEPVSNVTNKLYSYCRSYLFKLA